MLVWDWQGQGLEIYQEEAVACCKVIVDGKKSIDSCLNSCWECISRPQFSLGSRKHWDFSKDGRSWMFKSSLKGIRGNTLIRNK